MRNDASKSTTNTGERAPRTSRTAAKLFDEVSVVPRTALYWYRAMLGLSLV